MAPLVCPMGHVFVTPPSGARGIRAAWIVRHFNHQLDTDGESA